MKNAIAILVLSASAAFAQTPVDNTVVNDITAIQNACAKLSADLQVIQTDIQTVQAAGGVVLASPPAPPTPAPVTLTESADMTTVTPGSGTILDSHLDVWNLNSNTLIQRNGVSAYNGWQSHKMVYHNHLVYIFGLDGNWYAWNGSSFGTGPVAAP